MAVPGDTSQGIADRHGKFTLVDFITWNPVVGLDCCGLVPDALVCVDVPGSRTPETPKVAKAPPEPQLKSAPKEPTAGPKQASKGLSPTQPGITDMCEVFHTAVPGDSCWGIVNKFKGLNLDDFYK